MRVCLCVCVCRGGGGDRARLFLLFRLLFRLLFLLLFLPLFLLLFLLLRGRITPFFPLLKGQRELQLHLLLLPSTPAVADDDIASALSFTHLRRPRPSLPLPP